MTDKKPTDENRFGSEAYKPDVDPTEIVKKHGGALSGAVIGGAAGSFIPVIGTIGGAIVGAVVGHLSDEKRAARKQGETIMPAPGRPDDKVVSPPPDPKKRPF